MSIFLNHYKKDGKDYFRIREHYLDEKGERKQRTLKNYGTDEETARREFEEYELIKLNPALVAESSSQRLAQGRALLAVKETPNVLPDETIEVKLGDWWQLGNHRLFCGDTSSDEFKSKLPHCDFAFADPPYNAEVAEWDKGFIWNHDWLVDKADVVAVTPGIGATPAFYSLTKMPYKWAACCWITNGMTRGEMGFGNWIYIPIFSNGRVYRNSQDFYRITDWRTKVTIDISTTEDTEHKGRKPDGLLLWLIGLFAKKTVIDPFLGSGTTLFAAEQKKVQCYGGEISPIFCREIISRWNKSHPNLPAVRVK